MIGDVHGYSKQFQDILARIDQRFCELAPDRRVTVQVGDLIDRGPDSAGCLDIAGQQAARSDVEFITLLGNHEAFLKLCLRSDKDCRQHVADWLLFGGRETVDSLFTDQPCPPLSEVMNDPARFRRELVEAVSGSRQALLADMRSHHREGTILISHAGFPIHLPVEDVLEFPWDDMSADHWAWTREPSEMTVPFEGEDCAIVHGHSIHRVAQPVGARFPIDTGVYKTGRLSAVLFYEDWFEVLDTTS